MIAFLVLGTFCLALSQERLTPKEARVLIEEYHAREEAANAKTTELQPKVDSLRSIVAGLDSEIAELEAKLTECRKKPKYYGKYSVKPGDCLSMIAGYRAIYHDPTKWNIIYEANKDLIKNPNLIYPGWGLLIPGLDVYKVIPGDCLWRIANYISVYGAAGKWAEIYEANKDKIKDADLIYPGQEFQISIRRELLTFKDTLGNIMRIWVLMVKGDKCTINGEYKGTDPSNPGYFLVDVKPCDKSGLVTIPGTVIHPIEKVDEIICENGEKHEWDKIVYEPRK